MTAPSPAALAMAREGFAPCPTCRQYSHSIGEDQIAKAFRHFQGMFSHRDDGIPTQFAFDQETRDAAQVLVAALSKTEALVDALRPFAKALEEWGDEPNQQNVRDLWDHPLAMNITLGDFRRARNKLALIEGNA